MLWLRREVAQQWWGCRDELAFLRYCCEGSYSREGVSVMVVFNQIGGVDLTGRFPCIIVMGIPYPFNQVLELF
jgi:hypothetical protein